MFNLKIDSNKIAPHKRGFFVLKPVRDSKGLFTGSYKVRPTENFFMSAIATICISGIVSIALIQFGLV
jgi:hypothetical protein